MTVILSFSVNKELLEELNDIRKRLGFTSKSEIIRQAIMLFISENKLNIKSEENVDGILIILSRDKDFDVINIIHKFQNIIKSHFHTCLDNDRCLNIILIRGLFKIVNEFLRELNKRKNIGMIKFIPI